MAMMNTVVGNEVFGYWTLFIQDSAAALLEDNVRRPKPQRCRGLTADSGRSILSSAPFTQQMLNFGAPL